MIQIPGRLSEVVTTSGCSLCHLQAPMAVSRGHPQPARRRTDPGGARPMQPGKMGFAPSGPLTPPLRRRTCGPIRVRPLWSAHGTIREPGPHPLVLHVSSLWSCPHFGVRFGRRNALRKKLSAAMTRRKVAGGGRPGQLQPREQAGGITNADETAREIAGRRTTSVLPLHGTVSSVT
jgi:hypothetical protein